MEARRPVDQPRLRPPVDDRLLQRRGQPRRRPPEAEPGRQRHDRLGRLDELAADRGHQRRPPEGDPRRPHPLDLRLDDRAGGGPGRPARRPGGAGQPRPPGRGRGPRPGRRRNQRRPRAARRRPRGRLRGPRPRDPGRARRDRARLPADVRHPRPSGQLPGRAADRTGRRRRGLRHGLRLPDRRLADCGLDRPARRPGLRPGRDRPRLPRRRPGREDHPRRALVRAGLVDRVGRAQCQDADRRPVRPLGRGALRPGPGGGGGPPGGAVGRPRAGRLVPLPAHELRDRVGLRHDLAPGLLRRRPGAAPEVRPRQPERAARGRDLGARLRWRPPGGVDRPGRQVPARHDAA